jgi:predicted nucleic acid-binding protein
MIVVADTTPLNYLILIDEVDLLPTLFGKVLIPLAAFEELQHSRTPSKVRQWMAQRPTWLDVRTVGKVMDPALNGLDHGEREAIQLALNLGVSTVLMDEAEGRRVAEALHLEVRGTLGILERGARLGKADFRLALTKLEQTSFRLSPSLLTAFLKRNP